MLSGCALPMKNSEADTRAFELRTYYAAPGKLDDLNKRFREHTLKIFEKHGMQNIGYWTPIDNPDNKLIYIIAHASRDAAAKSWKDFGADPEWRDVAKASEANGRLVTKVESRFLTATDYSPAIKPSKSGAPHVFELRTYTATPGNLENLNARFRDHTVKLFKKHGLQSFGYWNPMPDQKGAGQVLVYILVHKSRESADAGFKAFRDDPVWIAAKKASEEKGGGSLTAEKGLWTEKGADSVFMNPTDYSPTK